MKSKKNTKKIIKNRKITKKNLKKHTKNKHTKNKHTKKYIGGLKNPFKWLRNKFTRKKNPDFVISPGNYYPKINYHHNLFPDVNEYEDPDQFSNSYNTGQLGYMTMYPNPVIQSKYETPKHNNPIEHKYAIVGDRYNSNNPNPDVPENEYENVNYGMSTGATPVNGSASLTPQPQHIHPTDIYAVPVLKSNRNTAPVRNNRNAVGPPLIPKSIYFYKDGIKRILKNKRIIFLNINNFDDNFIKILYNYLYELLELNKTYKKNNNTYQITNIDLKVLLKLFELQNFNTINNTNINDNEIEHNLFYYEIILTKKIIETNININKINIDDITIIDPNINKDTYKENIKDFLLKLKEIIDNSFNDHELKDKFRSLSFLKSKKKRTEPLQ